MASFTLSCETDFLVIGLQEGEDYITPVRILSTLCAATITSAWFSRRKIKRLSLFFAHWLSGLVMSLGYVVEDMMVTVCWTGSNVEGFVKTIKFLELAASNMLAITNLAICVNLALIIMSHRRAARVKSVSSPPLLLFFLLVSAAAAAATVPFWEQGIIHGTAFWFFNPDEAEYNFVTASMFYVEFIVGICMLVTVVYLLLFRMKEMKEAWKVHVRIRYYFGLTLLGTVVNLALGICGTIFFILEKPDTRLMTCSWMLRYVHIALDTMVLYGVLRDGSMDERVCVTRLSTNMSSGPLKP